MSGVRRCHTSHGSTLLARDAQTPGRTTATRAGRTNGRANARRQVRHSVEQLAAAEGVQRGNWPLVTSCNGKAPARSSRAAQERYSRRGRRALTATAPLSDRRFCGFFSVKADLTGTLYHRGGKMSREEAARDESFLLVRSAPKECLKSKDFAKYVME